MGYGDIKIKHPHTFVFLSFYILIAVVLTGFIVNSVQQIHVERKLLRKVEDVLVKKQHLDFIAELSGLDGRGGKQGGITEAEFVLAILEHLGTVDRKKDIAPWIQVNGFVSCRLLIVSFALIT